MKQILVQKGTILTEEIPEPELQPGSVKIHVTHSCISAGTELSNISGSGKSLVERVIEQPEVLSRAAKKISGMGLKKYWSSVQEELNKAMPSGYSLSGRVVAVGADVASFKVGDRVAAAGGIVASHAETAVVPKNLVVKIPELVDQKEASTVAIGAIALQGIRRADPDFGSNVAVVGVGLLGLLTVQMLRAQGCRVLAIDINDDKLELAHSLGAEHTLNAKNPDLIDQGINWADGFGMDAVIITASTKSKEPLSQAFNLCRRKGRVVLVGVTGMEIDRKDIYAKELDFYISTSYGPGRNDDRYEKDGQDYPVGYVRWTENRNMIAYLRALDRGDVKLNPLQPKTYNFDQASEAFEALRNPDAPILSYFSYPPPEEISKEDLAASDSTSPEHIAPVEVKGRPIKVAVVGTGSYAANMTIPLLDADDHFKIEVLVNRTPFKAKNVAEKWKVPQIEADLTTALNKHDFDAVFLTTNHGSHAELALQALRSGKHVFVEKPLAVNQEQLLKIKKFYGNSIEGKPVLTVGFNRRFSPSAQTIKKALDQRHHPLTAYYRMNAGYQPEDHWTHKDGGRIIGEGCHIIDLFRYLTGSEVQQISVNPISPSGPGALTEDNRTITIAYKDGSVCTFIYTSLGHKSLSKEYLEIFFDRTSITMDNYEKISGFGVDISKNDGKGDKGHAAIIKAFGKAITESEKWPVPLDELLETTNVSFISAQ